MTDQINSHDVLFGRGGATNNHIGNKTFRMMVNEHQPEYLGARKKDKALISRRIVSIIRDNGGRFLRRDESSGLWVEVGDKKATEKTSQALREGLDVRSQTNGKSPKLTRRPSESSASASASTYNAPPAKRRRKERIPETAPSSSASAALSPTVVSLPGEGTYSAMPDLEEEIPRMMPSFVFQNTRPPAPADFDNIVEI